LGVVIKGQGGGEVIVECSLSRASDGATSGWVVARARADKAKPNGLSTAWRNMEVAAEGLSLADLVAFAASQAAGPAVGKPVGAAEVDVETTTERAAVTAAAGIGSVVNDGNDAKAVEGADDDAEEEDNDGAMPRALAAACCWARALPPF
jgi:hypothetical protein